MSFFVSFNSPQCGWMSIGFESETARFRTTTAHAPHERALPNLLDILTDLLDPNAEGREFLLHWNRNPEEFDFWFARTGANVRLEIWQYAAGRKLNAAREKVFIYEGDLTQFCDAFFVTFSQLRDDRETDEFEQNWRQPFPHGEFDRFAATFQKIKPQTVL